MIKRNHLILLISLLLLNACAEFTKTQSPAKVVNAETVNMHSSNEALLDFAEHFADLSAESQKKELSLASQNKQDINSKIKVAMIYALPGSKLRDTAKAQFLLDELARDKSLDKESRSLVSLLAEYTNDSNRLALKLRDEQKRGDTLQQKLDDLKNIEKTMVDRDQGVRK
ncbi:MAG TPA: hypothetical protein VIE91_00265 [Methylophilaceae bacterium]|jgi:hypothetical protein